MLWLREHFSAAEIGVGDLIAQEVAEHLRSAPKLQEVFGGRIYALPFLPQGEPPAQDPELLVTPLSWSETAGAGTRDGSFVVYVVARFPWPRREEMRQGDPGLATLTQCVRDHMLADGVRRLPMETPIGTVRITTNAIPEAVNYLLEGDASRAGYSVVMPWRYEVPLWDGEGVLKGRPRALVEASYYE